MQEKTTKKQAEILPFKQDAAFFLRRGDLHWHDNHLLQALALYHQAVIAKTDDIEAWGRLFLAYDQMQCFDLANLTLLSAFRYCPTIPNEWYHSLGCNFLDLHQPDYAMYFFQRYAQKSENQDMIDQLDILESIVEIQDAQSLTSDIEPIENEDELAQAIQFLLPKGQQFIDQNKLDKAYSFFLQAVNMTGRAIVFMEKLAYVCFRQGDYVKAKALCSEIIKSSELSPQAWCLRVRMDAKEKNSAKLAHSLQQLRQCEPETADDEFQMALVLAKYGELDEAEPFFQNIRMEFPYRIDILFAQAQYFIRRGEMQDAFDNWRLIDQITPNDPIARFYESLSYQELESDAFVVWPQKFSLPKKQETHFCDLLTRAAVGVNEIQDQTELMHALVWAFYYGNATFHTGAGIILKECFPQRARVIFQDFLIRQNYEDYLKEAVIDHLIDMQVPFPYYVLFEDQVVVIASK